MNPKRIQYKGREYKSLNDLYGRFSDIAKVGFSTFCDRVSRGWEIGEAIESPKHRYIRLTYNGVKYDSALSLYREEKRKIRATRHRKPAITYAAFIDITRSQGVSAAIKHMHLWHLHPSKKHGLKSKSKELGGADNLVCQRMTKLGWSRKRAENTPVNTKHLPIRVHYHGNIYPSITACFKAVSPGVSLPKFTAMLRKKNFHVD